VQASEPVKRATHSAMPETTPPAATFPTTLDGSRSAPERSSRGLLVGRLVLAPKMIDGQCWFEYGGEATYNALPHGRVSVNGVVPPGTFARFC
jgi:hypothetical protein